VRARLPVWCLLGVAVVLGTRQLVYAIAPVQATIVAELEHRAGGPRIALSLVAVAAAAALAAAALLWLAVVAVRERLVLERRPVLDPPRLDVVRLAVRAVLLFCVTTVAFAYLESYIHWREGLGWHGLHCVLGPVHRDALPVLAALSLLAVAVHGALEHLLAWARRLVAALAAGLRPPYFARAHLAVAPRAPRGGRIGAASGPRGPPRAFTCVL
jgi:Na+/proline symporter